MISVSSASGQKLLEIEKDIVREVARGDKHYLRKSADRKLPGTNQ